MVRETKETGMLKKAKAEAEATAGPMEQAKELSQSVLNSSHQIWLAGLGAFARAQQEGMKVFETLVQQGQQLESRTRQAAADTASAARGAASAKAKEMQKMAGGTWDKLEQVFEDRVARALSKLGVYTQNDVERLAQRVDALSEAVNRLINAQGGTPLTTAKRGGASATKRSAAKKGARPAVRKSAPAAPVRKTPRATKQAAS
jgi:poly(hydroxyalkanoate) granule-associated protein